jgi:hypothetical protein
MRALKLIQRILLLVMLFHVVVIGGALAQTGSPTKLYLDEINRLKEQKTALTIENETYKHAYGVEQQKNAELQKQLQNSQAAIAARDEQVNNANAARAHADSRVARWYYATISLVLLILLMVASLCAYIYRDLLAQQLRKLLEFRLVRVGGSDPGATVTHIHTRAPRRAAPLEEGEIPPEEIFKRLYGGRRAS